MLTLNNFLDCRLHPNIEKKKKKSFTTDPAVTISRPFPSRSATTLFSPFLFSYFLDLRGRILYERLSTNELYIFIAAMCILCEFQFSL